MNDRAHRMTVARFLSLLITIGWLPVTSDAANPEAALQASLAELPLEKRLCRLYFDPIRPASLGAPRAAFHGMSPEACVDIMADMGVEVWQGGVTFKGVWFPSKMVKQSEIVPFEHLQRAVNRAHEHGMLYQGCQQLSDVENQDLEGRMKEWAIHPLGGGEPNPQFQSYACEGYREWMGRHMVEHVTIGGIDGFWFDGSPFSQRIGWPWPAGDVGPCGAADFKAATGFDPPEKEDWKDPVFRQWVKWRYDTSVNFMQAVCLSSIEAKPHTAMAVVYNMHNVDWQLGLPLRDLSEMAWYPGIHDETSLLGRIGRALSPRAEQWFWAQYHHASVVHGEGPHFDPGKKMAKCLRAVAHGTAPSVGGWHADIALWREEMKLVFTELKKRRPYFGGETLKYAALVVSQQTRDYRRDRENFWKSVEGLSEIQNAENLLTDVLFDEAVTVERLAAYPVVLLPNVSCLSDAQCEALRAYVHGGGHLLATQETSLYDEWGDRRENFGLADLFGVEFIDSGYGTQLYIPRKDELRAALGRVVGFIGPSANVRLREGGEGELLFSRPSVPNFNGVAVDYDDYTSDTPEVVRTRYGKGTATYISVDVGHGYQDSRLPNVARMVAKLQDFAVTPPVTVDESSLVETTGYLRGENQWVLHLVNLTALHAGTMTPLGKIGVRVNEGTLTSARLAIAGESLPVKDNRVVVPNIGWGEVLVLDVE
jgi:hypothetical protein